MLNAIITLELLGTLGSAGREKMKTLHVVTDNGRFPKSRSQIIGRFAVIKLNVYI
jgi:hypothetical protein